MDWTAILLTTLYAVLMIAVVMTIAGYSVLAERKVASWAQGRVGPNRTTVPLVAAIPVIGRWIQRIGLIQLPADGLKFLFKEEPTPGHVNKFYYVLAPILSFIPAMLIMVVIPFGQYTTDEGLIIPLALANVDIGMLFILAVSSLGVYGLIMAGWASNSKYPFLGGIRASAQMISYELSMGLSILPVFLWMGGTLNLAGVVAIQDTFWMIIIQPISALVFLVALFAETNRLPFDMPESETDLVAGFNTEYGAFKFGLFFVGEYAHVVLGSAIFVVLFLGGWDILPLLPFLGLDVYPEGWLGAVLSTLVFIMKVLFMVFFFMWMRWTLPRFRYDQVMNLGWTRLLPLALANLIFYAIIMALIV